MEEIRYQNIELTIPNGALANQVQSIFQKLDQAYNRITGIQINVITPATLGNNLLIGVSTERKTWVDQIPWPSWDAQSGVGPDDKFMCVNIPYGSGDSLYINATPLAVPGADVVIYATIRLTASLVEMPK